MNLARRRAVASASPVTLTVPFRPLNLQDLMTSQENCPGGHCTPVIFLGNPLAAPIRLTVGSQPDWQPLPVPPPTSG